MGKPNIKTLCVQCGAEKLTYPCHIRSGKPLFCSVKCRTESTMKRITLPCVSCGKQITKKPSDFKRGRGSYCSRECMYIGVSGPRTSLSEQFWKYVEKTESCWIWTGSRSSHNYGQLRVNNKLLTASRISYELHKGEIKKGLCVLHACDNPPCVNPEHLWLGTKLENVRDMISKRRAIFQIAKKERGRGGKWLR